MHSVFLKTELHCDALSHGFVVVRLYKCGNIHSGRLFHKRKLQKREVNSETMLMINVLSMLRILRLIRIGKKYSCSSKTPNMDLWIWQFWTYTRFSTSIDFSAILRQHIDYTFIRSFEVTIMTIDVISFETNFLQ